MKFETTSLIISLKNGTSVISVKGVNKTVFYIR